MSSEINLVNLNKDKLKVAEGLTILQKSTQTMIQVNKKPRVKKLKEMNKIIKQ